MKGYRPVYTQATKYSVRVLSEQSVAPSHIAQAIHISLDTVYAILEDLAAEVGRTQAPVPATSLASERVWLAQLQSSQLIGLCFLDDQDRLVQRFDDLALREAIIAYQADKVRQLELVERHVAGQTYPKPYPRLSE